MTLLARLLGSSCYTEELASFDRDLARIDAEIARAETLARETVPSLETQLRESVACGSLEQMRAVRRGTRRIKVTGPGACHDCDGRGYFDGDPNSESSDQTDCEPCNATGRLPFCACGDWGVHDPCDECNAMQVTQ